MCLYIVLYFQIVQTDLLLFVSTNVSIGVITSRILFYII